MPTIKKLEDVIVWQKARVVAKRVYELTSIPPLSKDYRLKDQMRGSCGGTMDNIAEGYGRASRLESINSYSTAKGEAEELKSQIYRCSDVGYFTEATFNELYAAVDEIVRMLFSWIEYLNSCDVKGQKFKGR